MKCKKCGDEFEEYEIYDLTCGQKADSYICRQCFLESTLWWDLEHGVTHTIKHHGRITVVNEVPNNDR